MTLRAALLLVVAVAALAACSQTRAERAELAYPGRFPTEPGAVRVSPHGVRYSADRAIDVEQLDFVVRSTDACFREQFPRGRLPSSEVVAGHCREGTVEYLDWHDAVVLYGPQQLACDGKQELLQVDAPVSGCRAKGIDRDWNKCPCRWRSGVREGREWWQLDSRPVLITTSSNYMLSDALARYMSGCLNPWATKQVIKCARPRVPMLPQPER